MFQQKPPTMQTQEDEADAGENTGGEESKNADIKMEVFGEFGDENNGRRNNAGYQAKKRLSLQEYEAQFAERITTEMEVFRFAAAKLGTVLEKNVHMESFILKVFRDVETAFVTTNDSQQCATQTIVLANEHLTSLIRLL